MLERLEAISTPVTALVQLRVVEGLPLFLEEVDDH